VSEEEVNLRILGVEPGGEVAGAQWITIRSSRGPIALILHPTREPHPAPGEVGCAALCVSGAIGGFDGPAALYPRLGLELPRLGVSVARLNYRAPDEFRVNFLGAAGQRRIALIGHSMGGAVAINAGTLSPAVATVIAISSQLAGAHVVGDLAPRTLLLIHGTADMVLSHESSQTIYERAKEPKTLKLFPGADHRFSQAGNELFDLVRDWLLAKLEPRGADGR
jgi:uncharacterized protein